MSGLESGGFIAIVIVILILNVAGVIGYHKFIASNPDKAVFVKLLDSGIVSQLRYVDLDCQYIPCFVPCVHLVDNNLTHSLSSASLVVSSLDLYDDDDDDVMTLF